MLKNAKQIILAKFIEAVFLYFIFFTDESNVEIVDYYENQMVNDKNTSYLTSVICEKYDEGDCKKNNEINKRIY